jgi:hypothetical protein
MPIVNIGNAVNLFDALKSSLSKHGLDFSKSVAFMSDTTNVMKGARSGVQKLIRNEHPNIYDVGCICHLADLTVKAGMKALPVDIDKLFIDVFYYFQHSSKRKQDFVDHWNSLFTDEPTAILKHCTTRWLSLLRCVSRQLEGLKSYFLSCNEQSSKVVSISDRLSNPLTKPLLHFLSYILLSMDRFNRVFQKSTEYTTSQLYTEMSRLTRLYAANLLQRNAITSEIQKLKLDIGCQLPDENLGVGTDTWTCLSELQEEYDLKPFFTAVREFYTATLKKMLQKFPFGDSLLKNLSALQPDKTSTFSDDVLLGLAKRFSQLGLADANSLDCLREEFLDFCLSPSDLPTIQKYKAADKTEKICVGDFWNRVSKLPTVDGKPRFGTLCKLMFGLLTIPCSNADSERGFSMLRKIHTDQRSNLEQSTIISLMTMKFNCDSCCYDATLDEELLKQSKRATVLHLNK